MGARLVVAQETQKGRRWDETKIKALTGGDKVTARFMRQDFFDFVPTFKLFIAGNHKPRLSSVDEAIRRRLLLVPFTVRIPVGERDPELAEKLWVSARPSFDGASMVACNGSGTGSAPPACVRDGILPKPGHDRRMAGGLHGRRGGSCLHAHGQSVRFLKTWCEERNIKPGSTMALSGMLEDRGYTKRREGGTGQRGFAHIVIKKY